MSFCKECGTPIEDNSKFCSSCGTPVSKTRTAQSRADNPETGGPTLVRDKPSYGAYNPEDLPKGFVIDNRYEIKEKLGQGGFGAVYRAYDRNLGIDKALKIIPSAVGSDFEAMINLRAETKALINLNHYSIVRVYDFHESGSIKYIDMELIEGKSLSQIKAEASGCRLPEKQVMEYAVEIAEGMAHAHSKGIIHRDIKPQNVVITKDNHAKILDFGIAQTLHTSMSRLVNTGSSGTLVYMSPEQIRGQDIGKESDIYSFGAMLYELLSGKPPFWQGAIEHQILNEQPKPLTGVSQSVNSFVMRCLEKDYRQRKLTFAEIAGKLQKPEESSKVITQITGENEQTDKKEPVQIQVSNNNNNNMRWKMVIVICVIVIGVLAGVILMNRPKDADNSSIITNAADDSSFVWIPGGTFMMGSNDSYEDERPVHQVTVNGFYMSKTLVTQEQYERVMGNNPSKFKNCPTCPVERVTWNNANEYCKKVGGRLPTEAEWEYACRAGSTTKYYWGDTIDGDYCWYGGNAGRTHPVAHRKPNAFGLYDMSGNVWEWCNDRHGGIDDDYYKSSPSQNPQGVSSGKWRMTRGGSWENGMDDLRSARRDCWLQDRKPDHMKYLYVGFRCVRSQ